VAIGHCCVDLDNATRNLRVTIAALGGKERFVAEHALGALDQNLHPDFDNSIAGNPEVFGCVRRPPGQPNE
jgi:hypothetical protein